MPGDAAPSASGDGRARQVSRRSLEHSGDDGGSRRTVLIALAANAVIAVVKLAGGLMSGSTALLAEAAHSLADTVNQGFILTSIALARREPTEAQPFGHGQQRFLWTFIAAIGMFLAGAIFALGYGIVELMAGGESSGGFLVAWVTLVIAFAAEGTSWVRAVRQTRGEARAAGKSMLRHVRETRDPSVKMVLFEDTAALLGVVLAAIGVGLHQATGLPAFDSAASIAIGLLLIAVAGRMGRDTSHLLLGGSATEQERAAIERVLEDHPAVVSVQELLTMALGPKALLVAARVDVDDSADGGRIERASDELDAAIREAVPDATEVFLDATTAAGARQREKRAR